LANPGIYLASCRQQLALLEQQADTTIRDIEDQLKTPDMLPVTKRRLGLTIDAIRGQAADIHAIVNPLLPGDSELSNAGEVPADDSPALLKYIYYLYRDWGWPSEPNGENEHAIEVVEAVLEQPFVGRTLVLGAGACRLSYDLHRLHPNAETLVMDIDPLLFAVAHTVIRGGTVSLLEANAEIDEIEHVTREWVLSAQHGALDMDRFHFVLADGLEPPLASGMFDTVVTPWFIDLIPTDLRDLISTVHRLLKPGGRWINLGPLRYTAEHSASHRFTREEVFDLAERAGFRLSKWQADSVPYLVSKLSGSGKVERTLAFAAIRLDRAGDRVSDMEGGPPDWLLFRHRPIPTFAGQSLFWSKVPLVQLVISSIDGRRTLDDLVLLVASRVQDSGLSMNEIREAVRRCIAEIHPGCRDGSPSS
jgi:SAM-dependent methyltransferase